MQEFDDIDESLGIPSFAQARTFAEVLGVHSEEAWQYYTADMTRTELFNRVTTAHRRIVERIGL